MNVYACSILIDTTHYNGDVHFKLPEIYYTFFDTMTAIGHYVNWGAIDSTIFDYDYLFLCCARDTLGTDQPGEGMYSWEEIALIDNFVFHGGILVVSGEHCGAPWYNPASYKARSEIAASSD